MKEKPELAEMYMEPLRMVIEFELKHQKMKHETFYQKMTEVKLEDDFFKGSTSTIRRYLKGDKLAGKDTYDFFRASSRVLNFSECALLEMMEFYLFFSEKETVTQETYENYIRIKGVKYDENLLNFLQSKEYRKMKIEATPKMQLCEIMKKFVNRQSMGVLTKLISLYNSFAKLTKEMKLFWEDCMMEWLNCDDEFFDVLDGKITNTKVTPRFTPDFWILIEIKNGGTKQTKSLTMDMYRNHTDDVNWEYFFCVAAYYKLSDKDKDKFIEIALKYSFLKRRRDFIFLAKKVYQE